MICRVSSRTSTTVSKARVAVNTYCSPVMRRMFATSRMPQYCESRMEAPEKKPKQTMMKMKKMRLAAPTAASSCTPKRPIIMVSIMFRLMEIRWPMIMGMPIDSI